MRRRKMPPAWWRAKHAQTITERKYFGGNARSRERFALVLAEPFVHHDLIHTVHGIKRMKRTP